MSPLVSVIIPTYNRANYVGKAVLSVASQTYKHFEIIVVDDDSEDDTEKVLSETGIDLVYERVLHGGSSLARNQGLVLAKGDLIAFLDSDDWWKPDFLNCMITALQRNSSCGFAYCDYAQWNEEGLQYSTSLLLHEKISGDIFALLLKGDYIHTSSLMVRRTCIEAIGGFDPELLQVQDWDFLLRLSHLYPAIYLNQVLVEVLIHSGGISRNALGVCLFNLKVLKKIKTNLPDEWQTYRFSLLKLVKRNHYNLFSQYRKRREFWKSLKHGFGFLLPDVL